MAYNDFAVDRKALIEDIIEVLGTVRKVSSSIFSYVIFHSKRGKTNIDKLNLIINYILLTSYIKHKKHLTFA